MVELTGIVSGGQRCLRDPEPECGSLAASQATGGEGKNGGCQGAFIDSNEASFDVRNHRESNRGENYDRTHSPRDFQPDVEDDRFD
jgi:hypothetical protein